MGLRVVVVGAGIGGLTTAAVLARHEVDVDVVERRTALPETGTALGMWPEAVRALDAAGRGDDLRRIGYPQREGLIRRDDGTPLVPITLREPTYLISRPRLLELLYDAVPRGAVTFGQSVERLGDLSGYDVVVAADGSASRLREELWGAGSAPRELPYRVWRGTLPGARSDAEETWGPQALWGLTPREDGRTNWFACAHHDLVDDDRRPAVLHRLYGGWHAGVREAVSEVLAADPDEVLVHDLTQSPRLRTFAHGRVALVGDAAHTMVPNLGRGACEAILDGVTLAQQLLSRAGVDQALHAYDRDRRRRTQCLVWGARAVLRLAHTRRGAAARDAALRLAARMQPSVEGRNR